MWRCKLFYKCSLQRLAYERASLSARRTARPCVHFQAISRVWDVRLGPRFCVLFERRACGEVPRWRQARPCIIQQAPAATRAAPRILLASPSPVYQTSLITYYHDRLYSVTFISIIVKVNNLLHCDTKCFTN